MKFPGNIHIGLIPIIYGYYIFLYIYNIFIVCESAKIMHYALKVYYY